MKEDYVIVRKVPPGNHWYFPNITPMRGLLDQDNRKFKIIYEVLKENE